MEFQSDDIFEDEITVSSRIIDDLSSGLYHTPAACLKELINNAYDARAEVVNVFIKPDANRIIVEDDGDGMSREEFERHFKRISESHKRLDSDITSGKPPRGGRPKIGKIGIGLIAANELCELLEIYSTKVGSEDLLHVVIDFAEMRKPIEQRKRSNSDVVKADYKGEVLTCDKDAHYTQLYLTEVRHRLLESKQMLAGAGPQSPESKSQAISLYGLSEQSVAKILRERDFVNWKEFDSYSEQMLNVGLNVPVQYHEGWMPTEGIETVKEFEKATKELGFKVFYDGTDLRKPVVFRPPRDGVVVESFNFEGEHVSARGYFYAQHGTMRPNNLQGLLLRIRNAAVGEYDRDFWGFPAGDSPLIQKWISAEIWADERLEEAMNIDRRTLRQAHHTFVELRTAVHKAFRSFLNTATNDLYKTANKSRQATKAKELGQRLAHLLIKF